MDLSLEALFVMRIIYNQLPFLIHRRKIARMFARTKELYSVSVGSNANMFDISARTREFLRIDIASFCSAAQWVFEFFRRRASVAEHVLLEHCPQGLKETVPIFLKSVLANRNTFVDFVRKISAPEFRYKFYELNALLRHPIVEIDGKLWAPFPELIVYAATRGLYFLFSDQYGQSFRQAFGNSFAEYAETQSEKSFGAGNVISESEERDFGWQGKTNDFTVIEGDSVIMFECKTSGLFSSAKQSADLQTVRSDITKNIVGHSDKKGLYQLFNKIEAIRQSKLPPALETRYRNAKKFFSIILLYDQIQYANKPDTLKNLIDGELAKAGISNFEYQIWHIEELENLYDLMPPESIAAAIEEKFISEKYSAWDLNTFIYEKSGKKHAYLRPHLFVPKGDSWVTQTLERLADN